MRGYTRYLLSAAAVAAAFTFPFSSGPASSAESFMFALGALAVAVALFGFSGISRWALVISGSALVVLAAQSGSYKEASAAGGACIVLAFLSFHAGAKLGQSPKSNDFFLWAIVVAALINSLEGILQYLGLAGGLWPWVPESLMRGVALGSFRQPNLLATFLCCGVVCLAWLLQKERISQSLGWLLLILIQLGLAASASRIGLLCVLLLAVAGLVWRGDQNPVVTRFMVGQSFIFVASAWLMPWVGALHGFEARTLGARLLAAAADSRWTLWRNSIEMTLSRPWAGWGWGEFGYAHFVTLHDNRFARGQVVDNAHNLPLHLAVELGLPVATIVTGLALFGLVKGKPWSAAKQGQQFAWALLLVIGAHSLVEFPLWYPPFVFLAAIAAGHLASGGTVPERSYIGFPVTAAALVVLSGIGWVQYQTVSAIQQVPMRQTDARTLAINAASNAWLFEGYVDLAKLSQLPQSSAEAARVRALAEQLMHFSAEPAVIEPLLTALWQLNDRFAFDSYALRYCRAFPRSYSRWRALWSQNGEGEPRYEAATVCR